MARIALMGASGFVGSRMVEMFYLGGLDEVRPIVRSFASLARLSRFDLDCRIAEATDEGALADAFAGCDFVVHSVVGHPDIIEASIGPVYRAAASAKVKRIVYLSTASVFGQSPAVGTDDNSPVSDKQFQNYNNLKVRAERQLLREREKGDVEVVILRPGIVFGPRDRWVSAIADDLLRGTAYLVSGGTGICNSIYVDNLVHAIHLSLMADADKRSLTVSDSKTVTWEMLYEQIADALGLTAETIHKVAPPPEARKSLRESVDHFRSLRLTQGALPLFPGNLKRSVKAALMAWPNEITPSPWSLENAPMPSVTREMADLHTCRWKLPFEIAGQVLGYEPIVTFEEGMDRSIEWLKFAGYPVVL